nr:MAG TPA: Terminase small subunit [Caudoviricetes sp.]DAS01213.1 MAG TPA: Terminase small subunit [Caudoviricetes sp.]
MGRPKKVKDVGGRPTKMTKEVLEKLEYYLSRGVSVISACGFAGIDNSTFYDWKNNNKDFANKVEIWQNALSTKAQLVIADSIEEGDKDTAKWFKEKTDKRYNPKHMTEVTGADGGAINIAFRWEDE